MSRVPGLRHVQGPAGYATSHRLPTVPVQDASQNRLGDHG